MGLLTETGAQRDERFMREALKEASLAADGGEVPVGAVIVAGGRVIARAHNLTERLNDVTAHAEMLAITAAQNHLGGKVLPECELYVTVEPCPMCAGAIGWARLHRVVWGAADPRRGFRSVTAPGKSPLHPRTLVAEGVLADECLDTLRGFFKARRR